MKPLTLLSTVAGIQDRDYYPRTYGTGHHYPYNGYPVMDPLYTPGPSYEDFGYYGNPYPCQSADCFGYTDQFDIIPEDPYDSRSGSVRRALRHKFSDKFNRLGHRLGGAGRRVHNGKYNRRLGY